MLIKTYVGPWAHHLLTKIGYRERHRRWKRHKGYGPTEVITMPDGTEEKLWFHKWETKFGHPYLKDVGIAGEQYYWVGHQETHVLRDIIIPFCRYHVLDAHRHSGMASMVALMGKIEDWERRVKECPGL